MGKCSRAKQMKTTILMGRIERCMRGSSPSALLRLSVVSAAALAAALALSACENVATYTQPSLVRVIDASYIAPAINLVVEGNVLAANVGQGTITPYGAVAANIAAPIDVTAATGGATIVTTSGALLAAHQYSVFLTDNGIAPNGYVVTILADQQIAAAQGHSAFRFLNQAAKTGAVDIYMVPTGATLATSHSHRHQSGRGRDPRIHQLSIADRDHGRYAHRRHHAGLPVCSHGSDRRRSAHRPAHR